MSRKDLLKRIKERARDCKTSEEARVLANSVPGNVEAKKIYEARCHELEKIECKNSDFKTASEAKAAYESAKGNYTKQFYLKAWTKFFDKECRNIKLDDFSASDLKKLAANSPVSSKSYSMIYLKWVEKENAESEIKAGAIKTSTEAKELMDKSSPEIYAYKVYEKKYLSLLYEEVVVKLEEPLASKEIVRLAFKMPKDSSARELCLLKAREVKTNEAIKTASRCKKVSEAHWLYYMGSCDGSVERPIYKKRWYRLLKKEALEKVKSLTLVDLDVAVSNTPKDSDAFKIYENRWMELHLSK